MHILPWNISYILGLGDTLTVDEEQGNKVSINF